MDSLIHTPGRMPFRGSSNTGSVIQEAQVSSAKSAEKKSDGPVGGHADNFVDLGNLGLAKIMPETEANMYSKYGESLKGLIPKAQFLDQLPRHALTPEQTSNLDKLRKLKPDEKIVVMEKVGQGQSAETIKLDVKIGKSTASKTQLEMEDHASPLMKKIKMTAADIATGSRSIIGSSRGYRVVGTNLPAAQEKERMEIAKKSNDYIAQSFSGIPVKDKEALINNFVAQLEQTKSKLDEQGITFAASSMFMSIDKKTPGLSQMKLIDLAHPIEKQNQINFEDKQKYFNEGIDNLISTLNRIKENKPA